MPRWDYQCPQCGFLCEVANPAGTVTCPVEGAEMDRQPPKVAFTLVGYTAANGYSQQKTEA